MALFTFKKNKNESESESLALTQEELDELNAEVYNEDFYSELESIDPEEELEVMSREETDRQVESLYSSGMDIEDIERIEYRRSAKLSRQMEYRAKVQDRADFLQALVTPSVIIGYLLFYIASTAYLWFTTGQIAFALIVSLIGSVFLVYWYVYQENKLSIKQDELAELESLARDITMQADVSSNTYAVIAKMAEKYNKGRIGNDVNMMFQKLKETGTLDTTRFNLYNFTPIELFMRNLEIWYTEGANTRRIFTRSVNNITFEILKRDELRKTNKGMLLQELVTTIMGASFPVVIRLTASSVYSVMIGMPFISSIIMTGFYAGIVWVAISLKKKSLDIEIR